MGMMRILCLPSESRLSDYADFDIRVLLYHRPSREGYGAQAGVPVLERILKLKLDLSERAWDLLSIGLSIIAADTFAIRAKSPDGWTRDIELTIAVIDANYWTSQAGLIEQQLAFLTTDRWSISFVEGGYRHEPPPKPLRFTADSVSLLSGGLDSLIGAADLVAQQKQLLAVSQIAQGDKSNQKEFARTLGLANSHLQLNHYSRHAADHERSQRARSFIFFVYGVIGATVTSAYDEQERTPLFLCENGFISLNPPLTDARLGSLSTRTTHPAFVGRFQELIHSAGFRVGLSNPYQHRTKGEMLRECRNQPVMKSLAYKSTSCGRFGRHGYTHCGHCLPCIIRRAAFVRWEHDDLTVYRFPDLDSQPLAAEVLASASAILRASDVGVERFVGASLTTQFVADRAPYIEVVHRGLEEIAELLRVHGVL